jgi:hypothetical protein
MCRWCFAGADGPPRGPTNPSEGQIKRQIKLKFQSEEENMEAPFLRISEKARRLVEERNECEQTIAELRKSAPSRNPIERAANQQKIADATLRVSAINTALETARRALTNDPEILGRAMALGRSLPGAKYLGMGLAKRHTLSGAQPLELGSPAPQEGVGEVAKRKGARRLVISRPWGGV